jgi:hypothetical protein
MFPSAARSGYGMLLLTYKSADSRFIVRRTVQAAAGEVVVTVLAGSLTWLKVDSKGNPWAGQLLKSAARTTGLAISRMNVSVVDNDGLLDTAPHLGRCSCGLSWAPTRYAHLRRLQGMCWMRKWRLSC